MSKVSAGGRRETGARYGFAGASHTEGEISLRIYAFWRRKDKRRCFPDRRKESREYDAVKNTHM